MINIRTATLYDINTVSCVLATSWKFAYQGIIHDEYLDLLSDSHWVDFLTTGIKNKTIFTMVLESEKNIIGVAILNEIKKENTAHLISLYLLPEKMKQGFGHMLYTEIETKIKNMGFVKCTLDVLEHNQHAINFYKAHGFFDTNEKIQTKLGGHEYICKVYEKKLLN